MQTKQWLCGLLGALLVVALPLWGRVVYAHAVLVRAEPAANAQLTASPHEIRLWFTEPLEPTYSSIVLRDATGATVGTPPSYVEPTDEHQMVLMVGDLADGLYSVAWRNVSSADGHQQTGNFPFIIGDEVEVAAVANFEQDELDGFDVLARWVNFWGLALAVGSVAFMLFVWRPATRSLSQVAGGVPQTRPLWAIVWIGWGVAGVGALLLLLNQMIVLLDQPLGSVLAWDKVADVINTTRFGALWQWRMGLWVVMGALLVLAPRTRLGAPLATGIGLAMLLPVSMHGHAAVGNEVALSIFSDWVHLAMSALWAGGLVQFLVAIPVLAGLAQPAPKVGTVVAYFSNYARGAVAGLIVTGIFATWQQVNTLEALTATLYGRLLSVKLLLAGVLIFIAGVNLWWTQRRLLAGEVVWVGRLRALVAVEVALVFAILMVVGGMTGISPARNVMAQREAAAAIPPAPPPQPIHLVEEVDDLQIHFTAMPGWVGNSSFVIQLVNRDGAPVTDARLIRLRFEQQGANLGESELQIRPEVDTADDLYQDGVYSIEGANLSAVGDWQMRMTVQRPDAFDAIADFSFSVIAPPAPPPAVEVARDPVLPNRTPTLLVAGTLALAAGFSALAQQRFRVQQGAALVAGVLVVLGATFLLSGLMT